MTEERLRELYGRVLAGRTGRADCVSPDALLGVVDGSAPEAERIRVLRHVGTCPHCRTEFDLLRTAADASGGLGRRRVPLPPPLLALAASVALVVGSVGVWRAAFGPEGDPDRAPPPAGAEVRLVAPAADAAAPLPLRLTWRAVPGARAYRAEVVEAGGRLVYETRSRDTTLEVPVTAVLVAGTEYLWWVQVEMADGSQARSAARRVRIQTP